MKKSPYDVKTNESNKEKFPLTQLLAAVICNFGQVCCGIAVGWLSPAIPQLKASGLLSGFDQETSLQIFAWMAAAFAVVAIVFTPLTALISENFGRRTCSAMVGIPFAINGLIVMSSSNIYWILAGRFIIGIGVALSAGNNQVFVGETVTPKVRGKLGSLMALSYTSGLLSVYLIGGFISYHAASILMFVVGVACLALFFVPETPAWLVKNGKLDKAYKSVAWYRRKEIDDSEVIDEIQHLIESTKLEQPSRVQAMRQLIHSKSMRRGFLICLYVIMSQGWVGMIAIHSYSVSIFMQSGAGNLSPEGATAVYGALQVTGAASTVFLIDKFGRKSLFTISCMSVSICMYVMGGFFHMQSLEADLSYVQWIPVIALPVCVYTYTVGLGSIPFILLADLLPNEVRSSATMIVMVIFNCNMFWILFFFGRVLETIGPFPIFYWFGSVAAVTFASSFFILPETKGKTTEQIMELLSR